MHRSNVTRYISNLKKDGIFEKIGKMLLVKDMDRLRELLEWEMDKE